MVGALSISQGHTSLDRKLVNCCKNTHVFASTSIALFNCCADTGCFVETRAGIIVYSTEVFQPAKPTARSQVVVVMIGRHIDGNRGSGYVLQRGRHQKRPAVDNCFKSSTWIHVQFPAVRPIVTIRRPSIDLRCVLSGFYTIRATSCAAETCLHRMCD